ncbi:zinc ABC transporter substrate-binding protein [Spirulina sp. CS-785/01]|uniref:metal ABC transporter solute-binding protein, Zn/Mn family n=1 Tax=Spirulina sp. CS-785/01 TaxID=3021716 RepID=UPI0023312120|nr:zinc ABC transporter substrate-binding protein [Spirulina sp. CS-785/01]MDB9315724.1 zinc ABC transporter substrate-binding protein [Spirulina sp. CS-785/01]
MFKNSRLLMASFALGTISLFGCDSGQISDPPNSSTASDSTPTSTVKADKPLTIAVSIPPQKYFVERVGGDRVQTDILLPPGANPATYEPKPRQLESLSDADAYVRIHLPFENALWERMESINPEMQVIDLTQGIEQIPMTTRQDHGEDHQNDQNIANPDPHIWLSPPLVKKQAQTIYDTLIQLDPEHQQTYKNNLEAFVAEIEELHQSIETSLTDIETRTFMVFHPAWGYFADTYNLKMLPIEVGGNEPSAAELSKLINEAEAEDIQVIFAQPQFSTEDAQTIANSIEGEVVLIDPLAEDWMNNMRKVANTFKQILD